MERLVDAAIDGIFDRGDPASATRGQRPAASETVGGS